MGQQNDIAKQSKLLQIKRGLMERRAKCNVPKRRYLQPCLNALIADIDAKINRIGGGA